jgi:ABC-type transport system substrate-binding protein
MQPIHDAWKDARVRKAMRLAIDQQKVLQIAYGGNGWWPSTTTSARSIRNTRNWRS